MRASGRQTLPSRFTLIAAANPCPCGRGEEDHGCECSPPSIRRYRAALSGALADRIDINLGVKQPAAEAMSGPPGEASASVRERVIAAREVMTDRYGDSRTNSSATPMEVSAFVMEAAAGRLLMEAYTAHCLSGRAHDRILRLARTIGDLDGSDRIDEGHVATALQLRRREIH